MKSATTLAGLAVAAALLSACGGGSPPVAKPAPGGDVAAVPGGKGPESSKPGPGGEPAGNPVKGVDAGTQVSDAGGGKIEAPAKGSGQPDGDSRNGSKDTSGVGPGPGSGSGGSPVSEPPRKAERTAPIPEATAFVPAPAVAGGPDFDPAKATATVKVTANVVNPPKMRILQVAGNADCAPLHPTVPLEETVVAKDGKLANVIVYVSKGADKWTFKTPTTSVNIDQKACVYVPHVFTLMVNQPLVIKNSDAFSHNVHAVPAFENDDFNRSQLAGAKDLNEKFTKPQVGLKIKCEVHGWMVSWAGVFEHPFHGVTAPDGTVSLKLPAGDYEIAAWHEYAKFGKVAPQAVSVKDGEAKEISFTFEKAK